MFHTTQIVVYYAKECEMKNYSNHNDIDDLISNAFDKIKMIVDANTIIGEKLETKDGTFIIPISQTIPRMQTKKALLPQTLRAGPFI